MKITMVKKIMEDGAECRKCREVSARLAENDELRLIDRIIMADVRDSASEGHRIAEAFAIETAPFFIVEEGGKSTLYRTYMELKRKVFDRVAGAPVAAKQTKLPEAAELNARFEGKPPQALLEWALEHLHPRIAFAWSGAEDVAVVDMLMKINPKGRIFTLDTGRLNEETYDLIDRVRDRYSANIDIYFPDAKQTEEMVRDHGANLFFGSVENRKLCCGIRKVAPLKRALSGLDGWITGLRRDQSVTRTEVNLVETDETFGGILKFNPLAEWSHADVWDYIRTNKVPYNALHDKGYPSIGCAPCTRAVAQGEDIRAGRWWWESAEKRECGLHLK